jgi:gas vesicle protein
MGTSTEELSSDIAQTRQSLTQDVDALQDRVSPSAIIERRKTAVRGRLSTVKDRVMGGGHDAVHGVSGTTSSAGDAIEQRVEGSPLAAGLIAFGAGLVIAGLIPASKVEAQGAQRLQEAVKEHGQPVIDEVRSAARQVGDQLKDNAGEAASELKSSAQESAERVKEEAPTSSTTTSDGTPTAPHI